MSQAARFYGIPHSTVDGWNKWTQKHASNTKLLSPQTGKRRERVLRFAGRHSVSEASIKFNVPKATIFRWRREER